ncbi:hypothetical protein [Lutimonas sp.]|uniref:hypothetical protein n=1 Tax=Lutimonas sp. TaxID=1872403 RepID=UPI003D9B2956
MITKCSSIVLALFILAQSFNLHYEDVGKISALVSHIEFHQQEYGDNLFAFISKHYGDEKSDHEDEPKDAEEHHKLPFNHNRCLDSVQIFVISLEKISLILHAEALAAAKHFFHQNSYTFLQNSDVFQPPRKA